MGKMWNWENLIMAAVVSSMLLLPGCGGGASADTSNSRDTGANNAQADPSKINTSATGFYVVPSAGKVKKGDTFTVDIIINTNKIMSRGAQCNLTWSPANLVNGTDIVDGAFYTGFKPQRMGSPTFNNDGTTNSLCLFCTGTPVAKGPSGQGVLFNCKFKALSPGDVTFTLSTDSLMVGDVAGDSIKITTPNKAIVTIE